MKTISLPNKFSVIVDDEDYDYLKQWHWQITGTRSRRITRGTSKNSVYKTFYMGRVVAERAGLQIEGLEVVHMDGNFLNCCRSNLKAATPAERRTHAKLNKNNTTGYKGVHKRKKRKRRNDKDTFTAAIKVDKVSIYLGSFSTAEEAALAYNEAAKKYYGEFGFQNKVNQ